MPVRIVTDSTSDLPPDLARDLGITVVPVYVRFGEQTYRDGIDISREQFYEKLAHSPVHPTTSQPSPADFAEVYRRLASEAAHIISVHVTGKLSGTVNAALQGKELASVKSSVSVIDSLSVTMGLGIIALAGARKAAAGATFQTVTDEMNEAIASTRMLGLFDTLRYLLRGGRIGKGKALLGGILNVRPVLTIRDGELQPVGNVRTRARGIERLSEFVRNAFGIQELAVIHSTTPDEARGLHDRLSSLVDGRRLHLARLGPALGVHAGPGMLAVALRKKPPDPGEPKPARRISVPAIHLPRLSLPHRQ